jgi:hypothetical protein
LKETISKVAEHNPNNNKGLALPVETRRKNLAPTRQNNYRKEQEVFLR